MIPHLGQCFCLRGYNQFLFYYSIRAALPCPLPALFLLKVSIVDSQVFRCCKLHESCSSFVAFSQSIVSNCGSIALVVMPNLYIKVTHNDFCFFELYLKFLHTVLQPHRRCGWMLVNTLVPLVSCTFC